MVVSSMMIWDVAATVICKEDNGYHQLDEGQVLCRKLYLLFSNSSCLHTGADLAS